MENKKVFGTILVLGLIIVFLIFGGAKDNNITGNVVGSLVGETTGLFAFIFLILILVIIIGGHDWITSHSKD